MSKRHKRQRFYETMKIGYIRVSKHEQKDLIETLNLLDHRGVDFISLTENIDTTTPGGKLIFHLMGALAEFECDLIRERTNAGLAAARARGRIGGRPALHLDARKLQQARELYEKKEMSVAEIMALTGFASRYSFYKYVVNAGSDARSTDKKGKRPNKTEGRENEGREKK